MDDDFIDLLEQIEAIEREERATERLLVLLQLFWDASEEVTVGLAA